jgi:hypothetical protein
MANPELDNYVISADFKRGFEAAKKQAIEIMTEWSRACHPTHPTMAATGMNRCWQHHGLTSAIRDARKNMKPDGLVR